MRAVFHILLLFALSFAFSPKADASLSTRTFFHKQPSEQVGGSQARSVALGGAALGAKSVGLSLDGRASSSAATAWLPGGVTFPGWQDAQGLWSASPSLAPGYHYLTATATHPSGWVAAPANSFFYVAPRAETVSNTYDEMGNVATRTWSLGKAQVLTWDGRGRLVKVVQTGVAPFTWTALYDGLNRRIRTTFTPSGGAAVTTSSVFDPEVEFLELGLAINGAQAWKVYGPDLSASYGGLQGLGGLEAVIGSDGVTRGIVNDWHGNTVGHVSTAGGALTWSPAQFLAFGPAPGWGTAPLDGTKPLHELLGYRGLTLDPPGYVQMGLRPYDAQIGRWLSPDPLGHAGSLSLYDYCDNDPLNVYDPDGRFGTPAHADPNKSYGAVAFTTKPEIVTRYTGMAAQGHGMASQVLPVLVTSQQMEMLNDHEIGWVPQVAGQTFKGGSLTYPDDKWYFSTPEGRDVKGTIDAFVTIGAAALPGMAGGFSGVTGLARAGAGEVTVNLGTKASSGSNSIQALRQAYEVEVRSLSEIGLASRAAGADAEATARLLHQMRRDLGVQYKALTPADELARIYKTNIRDYGDPLGPTIEWLRGRGKTWEQIIESASRPGDLKRLGY